MNFESVGLLIVAIYIWLPPASYVVFLTTLVYIQMNNENMSSGKGLTLVKTTLLPGQERVTVVASLPTNPSCDVTANIPIYRENFAPFSFRSSHPLVRGS